LATVDALTMEDLEGATITSFDSSSGVLTFAFPKIGNLNIKSLTDEEFIEDGTVLTVSEISFLETVIIIEPSGLLNGKLPGFLVVLMLVVLLAMGAVIVGTGKKPYERINASFTPF